MRNVLRRLYSKVDNIAFSLDDELVSQTFRSEAINKYNCLTLKSRADSEIHGRKLNSKLIAQNKLFDNKQYDDEKICGAKMKHSHVNKCIEFEYEKEEKCAEQKRRRFGRRKALSEDELKQDLKKVRETQFTHKSIDSQFPRGFDSQLSTNNNLQLDGNIQRDMRMRRGAIWEHKLQDEIRSCKNVMRYQMLIDYGFVVMQSYDD